MFMSRTRKYRFAFLHEGAAPLGIVVAGKAPLDQFGAAREVALAFILDGLADQEFRGLDRERSIVGDRVGIVLDVALKLGARHHAIDEPHLSRLLGIELTGGEENLLR